MPTPTLHGSLKPAHGGVNSPEGTAGLLFQAPVAAELPVGRGRRASSTCVSPRASTFRTPTRTSWPQDIPPSGGKTSSASANPWLTARASARDPGRGDASTGLRLNRSPSAVRTFPPPSRRSRRAPTGCRPKQVVSLEFLPAPQPSRFFSKPHAKCVVLNILAPSYVPRGFVDAFRANYLRCMSRPRVRPEQHPMIGLSGRTENRVFRRYVRRKREAQRTSGRPGSRSCCPGHK